MVELAYALGPKVNVRVIIQGCETPTALGRLIELLKLQKAMFEEDEKSRAPRAMMAADIGLKEGPTK